MVCDMRVSDGQRGGRLLELKSRSSKGPAEDSRRGRKQATRASRRGRYGWLLLSISLALFVAGLALLLVRSPVGEQRDKTAANPAWSDIAEAPPENLLERLLEGSPAVEEEPEGAPGFDAGALEAQLEEIVGEYEGTYGISVLEPVSGTGVSLRGDEEFVAASIGKLPPFAALYAAAARGDVDLEEEISIRSGDVQSYGSGKLHGFPVGHSLSLRECAYRLINDSDNTAWEMLDRRLGREEIGYELGRMGITDSSYYGHNSGYYTTPDDVLLLLEKISDPRFTDEELSVEMLEAMTETAVEDRIPEKLPEDVRIAHKTGSYEGNFGDAGVVFYRDSQGKARRYYLAVLSEGTGEYDARDVIQEISLAVYKTISGATVDPNWSRGSVRQEESVPDDPPSTPDPAVITRPAGDVEPTNTPPANPPPASKPPAERPPPESRNNAVPTPPAATPGAAPKTTPAPSTYPAPAARAPAQPPYPPVREPAYPKQSAPTYYQEKPGYWKDAY